MKRIMIILFAIGMTTMSSTSAVAMSKSKVRKEARFLTDKMSYELNLNGNQRDDVYEINYDFIYSAGDLMNYVMRGEEWAMDRYYYLLDIRNDDLRWVMTGTQYRRFLDTDYFYRPIYTTGNNWQFRIYITYTNHNHFFYGKPYHYTSYHCGHHRTVHTNTSYYRGRYSHPSYTGTYSVRGQSVYNNNRRSDFSTVQIRPGTSSRTNASSSSNRTSTTSRPATNSSSSSSRKTNTNSSTRTSTRSNNSNSSSRTSTVNSSSGRSNNSSSSSSSSRSSSSGSGSSRSSSSGSSSRR